MLRASFAQQKPSNPATERGFSRIPAEYSRIPIECRWES